MWENSDFYELGKFLGEKLKSALDNIPWDEIKETARKIGKSIATLINGFVEVEGLGYSIGKTLIEAINTVFEFVDNIFPKSFQSIFDIASDNDFPIFLPISNQSTVSKNVFIVSTNVLTKFETEFAKESQFKFSANAFIASPRPFAPVTKVSYINSQILERCYQQK